MNLFMYDPSNKDKARVIEKTFRFSEHLSRHTLRPKELPKAPPSDPLMRMQDIVTQSQCNVTKLLQGFTQSESEHYDNIFGIDIRKGTNILDAGVPCLLFLVTVQSLLGNKHAYRWGQHIPLKDGAGIRTMVHRGIPLYKVYGKIYTQAVAGGEIDLYEYLTGQKQFEWMYLKVKEATELVLGDS